MSLLPTALAFVLLLGPFIPNILSTTLSSAPSVIREFVGEKLAEVDDRKVMWLCPSKAYETADSANRLRNIFKSDVVDWIKDVPPPLSPIVSKRVNKISDEIIYRQRATLEQQQIQSPKFTTDQSDAILLQSAAEIWESLVARSTFNGAVDKLYLEELANNTIYQLQNMALEFDKAEKEVIAGNKVYDLSKLIPQAQNDNYQLVMAFYAIKSGGVFGRGLGNGMPETIPTLETDFVFVPWVESTGFLGTIGLIGLFSLLVLAGSHYAQCQDISFRQLLIIGLCVVFALQVIVIIGGNIGLLPLTGVTLPFMARGGAALVINSLAIGLLLAYTNANFLKPSKHIRSEQSQQLTKAVKVFITVTSIMFILVSCFALFRIFLGTRLSVGNCPTIADGAPLPIDPRLQVFTRGKIETEQGIVLAESTTPTSPRIYHTEDGILSHVIRDTEIYYNEELAGSFNGNKADKAGYNLVITIDPEFQQGINEILDETAIKIGIPVEQLRASVVVIDTTDDNYGSILALVSRPLFNMGLSRSERAQIAVQEKTQDDDPLSPEMNRVIQGKYSPGSTFKIITSSALLSEHIATPQDITDISEYNNGSGVHIVPSPNGVVWDPNCYLYDAPTLEQSFAFSCNSVFAILARDLGAPKLVEYAIHFGFEQPLSIGKVPVGQSTLDNDFHNKNNRRYINTIDGLMQTSFGQGELSVTPLHMALVAATIARGGNMPNPFWVKEISSSDRSKIMYVEKPSYLYRSVVSKAVALDVANMMSAVVNYGTGSDLNASVVGSDAAIKTGTAENETDSDHAWAVGFWPKENPKIAFAVIIERGGEGSQIAVPVVDDILRLFAGLYP